MSTSSLVLQRRRFAALVFRGIKRTLLLTVVATFTTAHAQQTVYNRSDSGTGDWYNEGNHPWWYAGWSSTERTPDIWPPGTRNYVFYDHNNNLTSTVNASPDFGGWYLLGSLTIQSPASSDRVFNSTGGGISLTIGFTTDSAGNQTFNVPIGIDASTVTFTRSTSATTTFTDNFYLNSNEASFNGSSGNFVLSGPVSGTGGSITKSGTHTLTLSGSTANTYTGATTVNGGVLNLNKSSGNAIVGSVTVGTGATLLISASNQVSDSSAVTLSGGTIRRGSGVSETMGNLTLTTASALPLGTGATGTLAFGAYTPGSLLTVSNFLQGNILIFGSDLTSTINNGSLFSFDNGFSYDWNSGTSTFTITAIPETSTALAALGLTGIFLWPTRRRLFRDARSVLGLRPPARDRFESYRHSQILPPRQI